MTPANIYKLEAIETWLSTQAGGMDLTLNAIAGTLGPQVMQSLLPAFGFGRDAGNIHEFEATKAWTPDSISAHHTMNEAIESSHTSSYPKKYMLTNP